MGAPWEIYRLTLPVAANSTRTRISDLYTKAGGQPGYGSVFALSPDHGIGYSVFVAGPAALEDRWSVRAAVGESFVTAAEYAAKENAALNFVGTFANQTEAGTNITLSVEKDHPGLGLKSWFVDGVEWSANLTQPALQLPKGLGVVIRLYPTGISSSSNSSTFLKYRAVSQLTPLTPRAAIEGGKSLFDDGCATWSGTGALENEENLTPVDEFVFEVKGGKLIGVRSSGADTSMERI